MERVEKMKYIDYIEQQVRILRGDTNIIRFPIEKRLNRKNENTKNNTKTNKRVLSSLCRNSKNKG